ncbi:hypothetical protein TNCV_4448271 [Trichonephila clavipes]|nr:hypothetical protein TNCV_4448271 [Trichonephila clavipes]
MSTRCNSFKKQIISRFCSESDRCWFPYDREDERFLSYKLFNCFGAKDNRGKDFQLAKKKLCAFLGFFPSSKLAFRNQERKLLKATERVAQENINAALSEIKGSNSFTKCGISIDGTWQRRGYSSFNGVIQNYYGIAIRNNVGNLQKMMSSVIAAFFTVYLEKNNSLHGQCPEGSEKLVSLPKGKSSWESPQRN